MGEMLSSFPARDVEEPVTKELLRADIADVHAEIIELRAAMHRSFNRLFAGLTV